MANHGKTLITGGTGLVGSAFPNNSSYIKLSSKDADLRIQKESDRVIKMHNPDNVIHCAAKVGGVGYNILSNSDFFLDNVKININVLESCRLLGVKKVLSFLSTCIFPANVQYPLTERKIYLGEPHYSNYGYAYAKRMLAVQTKLYRDQFNLDYTCVIPTNIYGPNDNFNLKTGHVIPSLIHKCFIAKKTNSNFLVWGDGKSLREFIFSSDVYNITEWLVENYKGANPIILSSSEEISIEYLVEVIAKSMNFNGKITFDASKPAGLFRKPTDNSNLKRHLPEYKFINIEDGIQKTVEWFIKNYEFARK